MFNKIKKIVTGLLVVFITLALVPASALAFDNLVKNGGFELPVVSGWSTFSTGTTDLEWSVDYTPPNDGLTGQLEIQRGVAGAPHEGYQHAELDSHHNTIIYQDIETEPGQTCQVTYWYSPRPNVADNRLQSYWNGAGLTIHYETGGSTTNWQEASFTVEANAFNNYTRLEFVEIGPDDSLGMYLDDVSVECITPADTIPPKITLVLPENGMWYSSLIPLKAECNETCDYINFWWRADDQNWSNTSPDKRYHYVYDDGTVFTWYLDPFNAERWTPDDPYIMEDGIYHFYAAGKDLAGNWAKTDTHTIYLDKDGDGVVENDLCPNTTDDSHWFTVDNMGENRWLYLNNEWYSKEPEGKGKAQGPKATYSIVDTHGCSCTQILNAINEATGEEFEGHHKFGCSKSILEDWIAGEYYIGPTYVETVEVSSKGSTSQSTNILETGKDYFLKAYGTYRFANWGDFGIADPEWSYRYGPYYPTDPAYEDVVLDDGSTTSGWVKGEGYFASECGLDIQVDGSCVDWGWYQPSNKYEISYPGTDNTIAFHIYDNAYGDNSGSLHVDIFEDKWVDLW